MTAAIDRALSIADIRELARGNLPRFVFEFIDGGAEDEITLARNRRGFEEIALLPRVLVDVARPSLATSILGRPSAAPMRAPGAETAHEGHTPPRTPDRRPLHVR